MVTDTAPPAPVPSGAVSAPSPRYPSWLLVVGVLGRAWLWFLLGCLLITLVPLAFGWQAFVVQSGSMQPRIQVGDVILTSREPDPAVLLGHVAAFDDPDHPGAVKTHRIVGITRNGELVTKGDANPTQDSSRITVSDVHGMGRLLVRFVGLPLVWLHTGQWLALLGFALSVVAAAWAVSRDQEREARESSSKDRDDGPSASGGGEPAREGTELPPGEEGGVLPGSAPPRVMRGDGRRSRAGGVSYRWKQRLAQRVALLSALAVFLTLPMTLGAFAATTSNGPESWSVPNWDYATEVAKLGPKIYYRLDDSSGTTAADSSGNGYTGTYNGGTTNFGFGATGALVTDTPNRAVNQTSTSNSCIFTPVGASEAAPGPATYTEIVWFKTAASYSQGGKLVGLENQRTTTVSTQYDRHIYMDGNGRLFFGVWLTASGTPKTVSTSGTYNDGNWHMVAATMGSAGMRLYVDGALQASDPNTTSETFGSTGYWRFGCGNLNAWGGAATWTGPNAPNSSRNYAMQGSLDEVSIFLKQLTASDIAFLYWTR